MRILVGLVATFLLWVVVVSMFYLFTAVMVWLTSRILPLTGRRKR